MGVHEGPSSGTEQAYPPVPAPGPYPYPQQAQPNPAYPPVVFVQPSAPPLTTVAAGEPVKPAATTIIITDSRPQDPCCTCSAGWYLFGFGWILSLLWIIGIFLPLCTKKRSDAWAALASAIALVVYAITLGLVLALVVVPILYSFS